MVRGMYIYQAIDRDKEVIERSFGRNESKYKEVSRITDEQWEVQLHRPLHDVGYFLNPKYFYKNQNIEQDEEVMKGLCDCIKRLSRMLRCKTRLITS